MKFVTYRSAGGPSLGVLVDDTVYAVRDLAAGHYEAIDTLDAFLAGGRSLWQATAGALAQAQTDERTARWSLSELALLAPVPTPGKIICVGLNYRRHAQESGMPVPETPLLFSKFGNTVAAPDEVVPLPSVAAQYDYEAELAVVIGAPARHVPVERALDHVFGYCNANDLSARDLQMRTSQWLLGKTLDKFMPLGPYIATVDEVPDPQNLSVRCWVNGDLRQSSNTSDMVFSVAELIAYISQYMSLDPGDLILTGTPEGVILGHKEKVWLKPGDEVAVEIEGLGQLRNRMGTD